MPARPLATRRLLSIDNAEAYEDLRHGRCRVHRLSNGDSVTGGPRSGGAGRMTPYYNVPLKYWRLARLKAWDGFVFSAVQLEYVESIGSASATAFPDVVIHLAAQVGVRHALEAPDSYIASNVAGTFCLNCRSSIRRNTYCRIDELGLWRRRQPAVARDGPHEFPDVALRGDQEVERGHSTPTPTRSASPLRRSAFGRGASR